MSKLSLAALIVLASLLVLGHVSLGVVKIMTIRQLDAELRNRVQVFEAEVMMQHIGGYDFNLIQTGYRVECIGGCEGLEQVAIRACAQNSRVVEGRESTTAAQSFLFGCIGRAGHSLESCLVDQPACTFLGYRSLFRPWILAEREEYGFLLEEAP